MSRLGTLPIQCFPDVIHNLMHRLWIDLYHRVKGHNTTLE